MRERNNSTHSKSQSGNSRLFARANQSSQSQTSQSATILSLGDRKFSAGDIPKMLNELLKDQFSITQLYPIQEGLLSLFEEVQDDSVFANDLHVHSRDGSGKMLAYVLFLLSQCLRRSSILSEQTKRGVTLIIVPDMARLDEIYSLLAKFAEKLSTYHIAVHVETLLKSSCLEMKLIETFVLTTPAVLASAKHFETLKPHVQAIVFDRAHAMTSDESIRKFCNIVHTNIAESEEFGRSLQIILASSYYSANVLRIKELLRNPLVVTLEDSPEERASDQNLEILPASINEERGVKDERVKRDVKHYLLPVEKSIDRYTWLYSILKRNFEQRVAQGTNPKFLIIVADMQMSFTLKIFFDALGIQADVFHSWLSKGSEEALRNGFVKKNPSAIIVLESNAENFVDVEKCNTFLRTTTHVVHFTRQQRMLDSYISRYQNTCEFFSSLVPHSGKTALPFEMITFLALPEEKLVFQRLDDYIRHNALSVALTDSREKDSFVYTAVSDTYMKAMKYRCEDVFHSKCSARNIRLLMAKVIGREMELTKKESQLRVTKRSKRKKRTRAHM